MSTSTPPVPVIYGLGVGPADGLMTTASPEPVAMRQVSGRDPEGRNILAVLAKATYRIAADGRLAPAEHQLPLNEAIVRDRELRLLRADTDLYPHKPATDVVLKENEKRRKAVPDVQGVVAGIHRLEKHRRDRRQDLPPVRRRSIELFGA